jgi:hypothetical protein
MLAKTLYFSKEQIDFLKKINGVSVSEHIRRAVDAYIQKIKGTPMSSLSQKVGESNG